MTVCQIIASASLALLLVPGSLIACDSPPEPRPEELLATVERLASPEFDGRLTGTAGNEAAARSLADRLSSMGGRPLPGEDALLLRHEQPVVRQLETPTLTVSSAGGESISFEPGVEFTILVREGTSPAGPVNAELLVLESDRARPAWIAAHAGAALVVDAQTFSTISRDPAIMEALFSPDAGPAAIVLVLPPRVESLPRGLYLTTERYPPRGPVLVQMTETAAQRLPATGGGADARSKGTGLATVSLRGGYAVERSRVASVAALFGDGHTPPLVVSAHLDGPGRIAEDWHFPGAVDNASGVAVALEVARMISATQAKPDRPVWIVLFNGEEQGMHGSRAFVQEYADRLRGAEVINIDMVGQRGTPLTVTTNPDAHRLGELAAAHLQERAMKAIVEDGGGSDHAAFAGVAPAISLVQAPYRQMHRRGDIAANADADTLARIAGAVYDALTSLHRSNP